MLVVLTKVLYIACASTIMLATSCICPAGESLMGSCHLCVRTCNVPREQFDHKHTIVMHP
jgi:hypothetical protein